MQDSGDDAEVQRVAKMRSQLDSNHGGLKELEDQCWA